MHGAARPAARRQDHEGRDPATRALALRRHGDGILHVLVFAQRMFHGVELDPLARDLDLPVEPAVEPHDPARVPHDKIAGEIDPPREVGGLERDERGLRQLGPVQVAQTQPRPARRELADLAVGQRAQVVVEHEQAVMRQPAPDRHPGPPVQSRPTVWQQVKTVFSVGP